MGGLSAEGSALCCLLGFVVNPVGSSKVFCGVSGKRPEGEECRGAGCCWFRRVVIHDMRPEWFAYHVVWESVSGGVVVRALRSKAERRFAAEETREVLARRVFMQPVRGKPRVDPCLDDT